MQLSWLDDASRSPGTDSGPVSGTLPCTVDDLQRAGVLYRHLSTDPAAYEPALQALWFLVSTGGNPATADHAIVYVDGITRSSPTVTIYKYDATLGSQSWQTAANLMVSTASGNTTAGDVMLNKVTEAGSSVRFQCVIDVSRVNNANRVSRASAANARNAAPAPSVRPCAMKCANAKSAKPASNNKANARTRPRPMPTRRAQNAPSARNVAVVSLKPRRQPKPSRPN